MMESVLREVGSSAFATQLTGDAVPPESGPLGAEAHAQHGCDDKVANHTQAVRKGDKDLNLQGVEEEYIWARVPEEPSYSQNHA